MGEREGPNPGHQLRARDPQRLSARSDRPHHRLLASRCVILVPHPFREVFSQSLVAQSMSTRVFLFIGREIRISAEERTALKHEDV